MCLIVFSWKLIAECPLIVAANRDEFYDRPSQPASWWDDHPQIFAPRDLQAGGTWLGLAKLKDSGGYKFAAVTNVRDGSSEVPNAPSRGKLVSDFLSSNDNIQSTVQRLNSESKKYNGFNLVLGEISEAVQELCWFSNRNESDSNNGQLLPPGIYGLSNGTLNSPWPKVNRTKAQMASLLCQNAPQEAFFDMLADTQCASDCRLPSTGVSLELERVLSSVCIETEGYGTRSSSLLELTNDGVFQYQERVLR